MKTRHAIFLLFLTFVCGCSVTNSYIIPDEIREKYVITSGDVDQPYESLGFIQITRSGMTIFGFKDLKAANLKGMFEESLVEEIDKSDADGIINLHFHEIQYNKWTRSVFAVLFIFPLPNRVEVTGELIKFQDVASTTP